MKICVIADIHGNSAWRYIVEQRRGQVDRFVFLGDYFDSKLLDISPQNEVENFREVVRFCEEYGAVDLLVGNHDLHYIGGAVCDGYCSETEGLIAKELKGLITSGVLRGTAMWGRYLFVHAGVSTIWMQLMRYISVEEINEAFRENPLSVDFSPYAYEFQDTSGNSIYQSPIWIRPEALDECAWQGCHQVVGHTPMPEICYLPEGEHRIIFCDTNMRQYLVIDTDLEQENIHSIEL